MIGREATRRAGEDGELSSDQVVSVPTIGRRWPDGDIGGDIDMADSEAGVAPHEADDPDDDDDGDPQFGRIGESWGDQFGRKGALPETCSSLPGD